MEKKLIYFAGLALLVVSFSGYVFAQETKITEEAKKISNENIVEVFTCLSDITDKEYEWIKDYFFYTGKIACFYKAGLTKPEKTDIYDISFLEQLSGLAIDKYTNVKAEKGFTYNATVINKDFVLWFEKTFIDFDQNDKALTDLAITLYENNKNTIRVFALTHKYLTKELDLATEAFLYENEVYGADVDAIEYLERYKPIDKQNYDVNVYEYSFEDAQSGYEDNYSRFRFSVGFWLRRTIDGTDGEFARILDNVMKKYDTQWYEKNRL